MHMIKIFTTIYIKHYNCRHTLVSYIENITIYNNTSSVSCTFIVIYTLDQECFHIYCIYSNTGVMATFGTNKHDFIGIMWVNRYRLLDGNNILDNTSFQFNNTYTIDILLCCPQII